MNFHVSLLMIGFPLCSIDPTYLTETEIADIQSEYKITKEEIIEFRAEFKAYDKDQDGSITVGDLSLVKVSQKEW